MTLKYRDIAPLIKQRQCDNVDHNNVFVFLFIFSNCDEVRNQGGLQTVCYLLGKVRLFQLVLTSMLDVNRTSIIIHVVQNSL